MKKILNISSLVIIGLTVWWLITIYSPERMDHTQSNESSYLSQQAAFKRFPVHEKIMIDFEDGNEVFEGLTRRERLDQIKDWLIYTIITESGLKTEEISKIIYDLPPVRYGYVKPVANFEYGEIRSALIGDKRIVALLPSTDADGNPIRENTKKDYLAHIIDKHRKNVGDIPSELIVFKYEINLEDQFSLLWRQESLKGTDLFGETYGYYESTITNLEEFNSLVGKIDDITFAKLDGDSIILGGRKLKASQYGGIRVEDIAAIWQSEKLIHEKIDKFNAFWQKKVDAFNARWAQKTYTNELQKMQLERQYNQEGKELDTAIATARIREKLVDASGFSLDPSYDYDGLAAYTESINDLLTELVEIGSSAIGPSDIKNALESLRRANLSDAEVPLLILIDKLKRSENSFESHLGSRINQDVETFRFQAARYDGYLQGTEVGMILFYTDLLAKIWAIDYMKSAPDYIIEDFVKLTAVNLSKIYLKESEELPSCRLWFGHKNHGFQVAGQGQSLIFARNSTRIFAASSNPLKPGIEVPASAKFAATLSWWNDHYEEVAAFEHEYEKLNQIMKWSLLIGWLNAKGKEDILDFLQTFNVVRSHWFPKWASDKKSDLKFTQWADVDFYPRNHKGSKTEAMPILYSYPFKSFGRESVMSGGVSLAGKNVFKNIKPVTPSMNRLVRRANLTHASSNGKTLKTIEGISYRFNTNARNQTQILAVPPKEAVLRGTSNQLIHSNFKSVISFNTQNAFRANTHIGDSNLGTFGISKTETGFKIAWKKGDIDAGQAIGQIVSKSQAPYQTLVKNPNVESFIKLGGNNNYLVKEINSNKLLHISPESSPSVKIQPGWTSRVNDVYQGKRNINLKWVEKKAVIDELGNEGAIAIESVSNSKTIMRNITNQNFTKNTVKVELLNGNMSIKSYVNLKTGKIYLPKNELPGMLKADPFLIKKILKQNDVKQISALAAKKKNLTYRFPVTKYADTQVFAKHVENKNYQTLAKELSDSPADFISKRNQLLNEKISHIDRLMESGSNQKAYYELKNMISNYGASPELTNRLEIASIRYRLGKINHPDNDFIVFTVKDNKTGYLVLDETGKHVYEGNKISDLMSRVDHRFTSNKAKTIYFDMKGFASPEKIEAFASSCRIPLKKHPHMSVKTLSRNAGTGTQDLFFAGKFEITKPLRVTTNELVTYGRYKGFYKTVLEGVAKVKGRFRDIAIEIYSKSAEIGREFVKLFNLRFSLSNSNIKLVGTGMNKPFHMSLPRKSPAKLVNEVRRELIKKYKLKEDDLIIKFGNEVGETEIVFLVRKELKSG